jgi:hypothetical protein
MCPLFPPSYTALAPAQPPAANPQPAQDPPSAALDRIARLEAQVAVSAATARNTAEAFVMVGEHIAEVNDKCEILRVVGNDLYTWAKLFAEFHEQHHKRPHTPGPATLPPGFELAERVAAEQQTRDKIARESLADENAKLRELVKIREKEFTDLGNRFQREMDRVRAEANQQTGPGPILAQATPKPKKAKKKPALKK